MLFKPRNRALRLGLAAEIRIPTTNKRLIVLNLVDKTKTILRKAQEQQRLKMAAI